MPIISDGDPKPPKVGHCCLLRLNGGDPREGAICGDPTRPITRVQVLLGDTERQACIVGVSGRSTADFAELGRAEAGAGGATTAGGDMYGAVYSRDTGFMAGPQGPEPRPFASFETRFAHLRMTGLGGLHPCSSW